MQLNSQAHTYASSERRACKKVLKQKHLYLTDDKATMRVANHFERDGIAQMMPALETGALCRTENLSSDDSRAGWPFHGRAGLLWTSRPWRARSDGAFSAVPSRFGVKQPTQLLAHGLRDASQSRECCCRRVERMVCSTCQRGVRRC